MPQGDLEHPPGAAAQEKGPHVRLKKSKDTKAACTGASPLSLHSGSIANVVCDSGLDSRWVFRVDAGGNSYIPSIERHTQ